MAQMTGLCNVCVFWAVWCRLCEQQLYTGMHAMLGFAVCARMDAVLWCVQGAWEVQASDITLLHSVGKGGFGEVGNNVLQSTEPASTLLLAYIHGL